MLMIHKKAAYFDITQDRQKLFQSLKTVLLMVKRFRQHAFQVQLLYDSHREHNSKNFDSAFLLVPHSELQ